jgi:hypothetical protein
LGFPLNSKDLEILGVIWSSDVRSYAAIL